MVKSTAACALVALGLAVPALAQAPGPQAPTIIPEQRGAPVPPPGIEPVRPTLERPVTRHTFVGIDRLDAGETSAERLLGQPVLGPDGQPLGIVRDILLQADKALGVVVAPASGQGEARRISLSGLRPAADGRSLVMTGGDGTGDAGEPGGGGAVADLTPVGGILNRDIASRDGLLAGQIHDLILDPNHRVSRVVVRLAALDMNGDVFISVPYDAVERRRGTDIYLFDDEVRQHLVEFRYPERP